MEGSLPFDVLDDKCDCRPETGLDLEGRVLGLGSEGRDDAPAGDLLGLLHEPDAEDAGEVAVRGLHPGISNRSDIFLHVVIKCSM